ncbi:MAG: hypothetical protein AAF404_12300, partial [Pseudomonadota bacterium]
APEYFKQTLQLTPQAQQILNNNRHAGDCLPRDYWLGGVHIVSDKSEWQWDEEQQCLVNPDTSR